MNVGQAYLEKLGWKKGSGLGKNGQGIKRGISVSKKLDTLGIGATEDFGSCWWDHLYNKTSANLGKDEEKETAKQNLLYGNFVSQKPAEKDYTIKISDAELFAACEGRTARKGARASQEGKLVRTADFQASTEISSDPPVKVKKSKKKKCKEHSDTCSTVNSDEKYLPIEVVVDVEKPKKKSKGKSKVAEEEYQSASENSKQSKRRKKSGK